MAAQYKSGTPARELVRRYGMSKSTLHKWIGDYTRSGSFHAKDNRSPEENELIMLRKELKKLRMENKIIRIFRSSRDCYGTRKIKRALGGRRKEAALVEQAFQSIRQPLDRIAIFHTDRGSEFKNECIDRIIKAFGIRRSLSRKGCPYDNAVAEATYSIFKAEFVAGSSFSSLKELERNLNDYVLW